MRKFTQERNDSQISKILRTFDRDSEGKISREELRTTLTEVKRSYISDADINTLLEDADENDDGRIHPNEFLESLKLRRDEYLIY